MGPKPAPILISRNFNAFPQVFVEKLKHMLKNLSEMTVPHPVAVENRCPRVSVKARQQKDNSYPESTQAVQKNIHETDPGP